MTFKLRGQAFRSRPHWKMQKISTRTVKFVLQQICVFIQPEVATSYWDEIRLKGVYFGAQPPFGCVAKVSPGVCGGPSKV